MKRTQQKFPQKRENSTKSNGRSTDQGGPKSLKKPEAKKTDNPFETIRARTKHNVLGRDNRGTVRNLVKARSKAIAARQASLLQEFEHSNKSGKFVDSRIGADEEEGSLKRFQEERQRRLNKAKRFALEEESADALTHAGMPLSLTEAESNAGATAFSDEEEDDAETGLNFGGGEEKPGDEERRAARSTKEVMEEVIAKSKMFKLEKQEAAKQQEERLQSLDGDLSGIRGLLDFAKPKKKAPATDDPEALLAAIREGKEGGGGGEEEEDDEQEDEFVSEARKLALEARARATDRLKTPEETAKEEHAMLQRLEAARVRRMNGEVVEEEEEKELAPQGGYAARRARAKAELAQAREKPTNNNNKSKFPRTDEDLDGNFELDPTLNAASDHDEDDDEEEDDGEEEEDEDEESAEEEQAPAKKLKSEVKQQESKQQPPKKEVVAPTTKTEGKAAPSKATTEAKGTVKPKPAESKTQSKANDHLPFVFDVPADYPAFAALLSTHSRADQAIIIRRMIACHTIALGPEQRPLLERLYSLLMDHFRALCLACTDSASLTAATGSSDSLSSLLANLDLITSSLWEISQMLPKFVGRFHRGYLTRVRKNLTNREREASATSSCMPSLHHLLYFKLLSAIFPVSDFRHHVVTPAMLIMAECLGRVPVKGARDVAAGLYLAELMLTFVKDSKRLVPELLVFLQGLIEQGFADAPIKDGFRLNMAIPSFFAGVSGNESKGQLAISALVPKDNSEGSVAFRAGCLSAALRLVRRAHALYAPLPSSPELFMGIEAALVKAGVSGTELKTTLEELAVEHTKARVPLSQVVRPPTIKQFRPAFEEEFRPGKDYDPMSQRAEIRKLTKKFKKEKRGALKELRRDTAFLANEKRKRAEVQDRRSSDKMKKVRQDLEAQQKDTNYFQREGKKKRKKK